VAHFWEGSLPARERPAIDSYPFAELERAIAERFGRVPTRADQLIGRAATVARSRAGRLKSLYRTSDR
jgi:uncharacterized protein (DUF924 family)